MDKKRKAIEPIDFRSSLKRVCSLDSDLLADDTFSMHEEVIPQVNETFLHIICLFNRLEH
jgi:hypothetical protein